MACFHQSHEPKNVFLPLLQLPGQVAQWQGATACHAYWWRTCCYQTGQSSVLCWSLELKLATETSARRAGGGSGATALC